MKWWQCRQRAEKEVTFGSQRVWMWSCGVSASGENKDSSNSMRSPHRGFSHLTVLGGLALVPSVSSIIELAPLSQQTYSGGAIQSAAEGNCESIHSMANFLATASAASWVGNG